MASYLISYDLMKRGQNYDGLYQKIKSYGTWCHLLDSVWIVTTEQTAVQIRDYIKPALDSNDKLFVAKLTGEAAWSNLDNEIVEWLMKNL